MRIFIFLLLIANCFFNYSLAQQHKNALKVKQQSNSRQDDRIFIYRNKYDSLIFSSKKLALIRKKYPELTTDLIESPDLTYAKAQHEFTEEINFNSELGQDEYYWLYAYLLKQKYNSRKFAAERKNLINIYRDINEIYRLLANGGTYFGHQYRRIVAYAEFDIYLLSEDCHNKHYDISRQKKLYIRSLRQLIIDELNDNQELSNDERQKEKSSLMKTVNKIDRLISNYFYLDRARSFQYDHY